MALPANYLQNVQTYQKTEIAKLLNTFAMTSRTNKKFKNFDMETANLGDTITFDKAPRAITYNGLVITNQPSVQRVQSLVCSQAVNSASAYSEQQFIFNARDYMERFGTSRVDEIGTQIESDIALNAISGVRINDPQNANFGALQTDSGPYRFYGDGVTAINSYTQLAKALANFRDFGADKSKVEAYLPVTAVPDIIGTGLSQFAPDRNNAAANSWELGRFSQCDWFESNLLPTHIAGTIGNTAAPNNIMTLVSTNDPTGQNVTQLTFTEPTGSTQAGAIKAGDLLQFNDGVSGKPNMRFLTFIGHKPTQQPVQFRAITDGDSVAGTVTFSVYPALVWAQNLNQNLNNALVAGMKATPLPSHRAGLINSGNQFYLAMPKLSDCSPYESVQTMDKESGASMRHYWGYLFGQNVKSYVHDCIWGSTLVPDNCMRLIFPL